MRQDLVSQAERICDEAGEDPIGVIVQATGADEGIADVLDAARKVLDRRNRTVSARDLMPPEAGVLGRRRMTPAAKKQLEARPQSMASEITMHAVGTVTLKSLMAARVKGLRAAARTPAVRRMAEESKTGVVEFWASGSFLMEVRTKDDVMRLATDEQLGPHVSDLYPNRTIRTPSPVSVRNLPAAIAQSENEISTWGLQKTNALAAWGAFGAKGTGTKVAVLDTGVDASHPTLAGRVTRFAEFDENGRTVKDGDGSIAYDSDQHGTHCAGTIAGGLGGRDKNLHIGVAPEAEIYAGLVLKEGSGTDAQILAGMQWAIENGVDVISMSLGGLRMTPDVFDTYTRTIITANQVGIPVIIAMGNDGNQTSGSPGNDFFAFAVGATDGEDRPAGFSGGRTQIVSRSRFIDADYLPLVYSKPDVGAPGVAVYSCIPRKKFASWNGTSMATPHVAGAVALLLSATNIQSVEKTKRAHLIQDLLTATVDELGEAGQDQRYGHGRIDILRAIGYAQHLGYVR